MKRAKLAIAGVILLFLIASCTYNIGLVRSTYKMLSASQISYDTALKAAADLYRQGRMSDDQKVKVIEIGEVYAEAHNAAVEALARYEETKDLAEQEIMTKQIEIAAQALSELLALIRPYLEVE